jgi:hypothetical protein
VLAASADSVERAPDFLDSHPRSLVGKNSWRSAIMSHSDQAVQRAILAGRRGPDRHSPVHARIAFIEQSTPRMRILNRISSDQSGNLFCRVIRPVVLGTLGSLSGGKLSLPDQKFCGLVVLPRRSSLRCGPVTSYFSVYINAAISRASFCGMFIRGMALPGRTRCGSWIQKAMLSGEFCRKPAM